MKYGNIFTTRQIANLIKESPVFAREVTASFKRYQEKDWGELPAEDKDLNNEASKSGGRILAAYHTSKGKIWIITEWDRSATTILFPNEY